MADHFSNMDRRDFLKGARRAQSDDGDRIHCISSAVVSVLPHREREVVERLSSITGVEVRGQANGRLVLVLEGPSSDAVGGTLAAIAVMDGVIAANMVFEHVEPGTGA